MKPTLTDVLSSLSKLEKSMGKVYEKGNANGSSLDQEIGKLGLNMPPCLRAWLLKVNGITLPAAVLFGIGPGYKAGSIADAINPYNKYLERGLLPIGSDGCGNDYVLEVSRGDESPVIFTESSENWCLKYIAASSLYHFLMFVILRSYNAEDQNWPFNEKFMLKHDPDIVKFKHTLPWNA